MSSSESVVVASAFDRFLHHASGDGGIFVSCYVALFIAQRLLFAAFDLIEARGWCIAYKIQPHRTQRTDQALMSKARGVGYTVGQGIGTVVGTSVIYALLHDKLIFDSARVPSFFGLIWQVGVWLFICDFLLYVIHRMQHEIPWLYQYHKQHHEFVTPNVHSTTYQHGADAVHAIWGLLLPVVVPNYFHALSLVLVSVGLCLIGAEVHSGYRFPYSPLVLGYDVVSRHDYHHSANVGNYSQIFPFDVVFGTDAWGKAQRRAKANSKSGNE